MIETPDIETSSANYARRFAGPAGSYLLAVQAQAVRAVIEDLQPGTVLDVGGAHGQLVDLLSQRGWSVTVHGTEAACEHNLRNLHGKVDCNYVQGNLAELPAPDRSYDLVIAVRLVSHVTEWKQLVREMCRVSKRSVILDYPSIFALNALTPLLFNVKKSFERNTRSYTSFYKRTLAAEFGEHGFHGAREVKQFFLPMVVHRMAGGAAWAKVLEALLRAVGLTGLAGSPVVARFDRDPSRQK